MSMLTRSFLFRTFLYHPHPRLPSFANSYSTKISFKSVLTPPEDLEKVYPRDRVAIEELRKMRILLQDELYKRRHEEENAKNNELGSTDSCFKVIDDVIIDKNSMSQKHHKISNSPCHRDAGFGIDEAIGHLKYMAKDAKNKDKAIVLALVCNLLPEQCNGVKGTITYPVLMAKNVHILVLTKDPIKRQQVLSYNHSTNDSSLSLSSLSSSHPLVTVGAEELVQHIIEGKFDYINRCLATPDMSSSVIRLARYLGPKGLMPNLKNGTLTDDLDTAIKQSLNSAPFRIERGSGVGNIVVGRLDMDPREIKANLLACFEKINSLFAHNEGEKEAKRKGFGEINDVYGIKKAALTMHGQWGIVLKKSEYNLQALKAASKEITDSIVIQPIPRYLRPKDNKDNDTGVCPSISSDGELEGRQEVFPLKEISA